MNRRLGVAVSCLVCACGPVDFVGTVVRDGGSSSIPVLTMGDRGSAGARAPSGAAQSGAYDASAPAPVTAADSSTSEPDSGLRAGDRPPPAAQPAADGCSIIANPGFCSRDRAAAFSHVLCACGDVTGPSGLDVRAAQAPNCAPVGVNGNLAVAILPRGAPDGMPTDPGRDQHAGGAGNASNQGPPGVPSAATVATIGGDLEVGSVLAVAGNMHVLGDVWSQTQPIGTGTLQIDGDLHTQAPVVLPTTNLLVGGMQRSDAHIKVAPCACDASSRLDIANMVFAAEQRNDNAALAIAPDRLAEAVGSKLLELNCGRYFLRHVNVVGDLTLRVRGHALVFVDGDFTVQAETHVELLEAGELDLFVTGNVTLGASARFADAQHAGSGRVYVGGQLSFGAPPFSSQATNQRPASMQLPAALAPASFALVGNVYAPSAVVQLSAPTEVTGSLFVGGLVLLQDLALRSALPIPGGSCGF